MYENESGQNENDAVVNSTIKFINVADDWSFKTNKVGVEVFSSTKWFVTVDNVGWIVKYKKVRT